MSFLTDFLSTYKPVQVVRLPLSSHLYKSNAVSALASAVSEISDNYALCSDLSCGIVTNCLSTRLVKLNNYELSVEHIDNYDILNIDGTRFYNITDRNIIQSVLPRTEVDASTTVFTPDSNRYFKLIALVDDRSMVDPDAEVNLNLDVVEINESQIDKANDLTCNGIYIRVPGSCEQHSVLSVGVDFTPDGTPRPNFLTLTDELQLSVGQVVNKLFFTGNSISTNGEFPPTRIDLTVDSAWSPYLQADSEYAQAVVEHEMRVLIQRQQKQITLLNQTLDQIRYGLSDINELPEDCTPEMQRTTTNAILALLSSAVYQ